MFRVRGTQCETLSRHGVAVHEGVNTAMFCRNLYETLRIKRFSGGGKQNLNKREEREGKEQTRVH